MTDIAVYRIPTEDPTSDHILIFAHSIGSKYFEPETMRFFGSILERPVYSDGKGGAFFVTSEQLTDEIRREIVGDYIIPMDNLYEEISGEKTLRERGERDQYSDRHWNVRYASFSKESIRTEPPPAETRETGRIIYVNLQEADEAAKMASEVMRAWDGR